MLFTPIIPLLLAAASAVQAIPLPGDRPDTPPDHRQGAQGLPAAEIARLNQQQQLMGEAAQRARAQALPPSPPPEPAVRNAQQGGQVNGNGGNNVNNVNGHQATG